MQLAQMLIPMVSAFAITIMFMPLFIGYMRYKKEGQVIREEGPSLHEKKSRSEERRVGKECRL